MGQERPQGQKQAHNRARHGDGSRQSTRKNQARKGASETSCRSGGLFQIMSTFVAVNTYTHSVIYVTDNILRSLQDIVRLSGLDPTQIQTTGRHLSAVSGRGSNRSTSKRLCWRSTTLRPTHSLDVGISTSPTSGAVMAAAASGLIPSRSRSPSRKLEYGRGAASTASSAGQRVGEPDVDGWSSTPFRSTAGMVKQSLGTTIEHSGLGAGTSYYRKVS